MRGDCLLSNKRSEEKLGTSWGADHPSSKGGGCQEDDGDADCGWRRGWGGTGEPRGWRPCHAQVGQGEEACVILQLCFRDRIGVMILIFCISNICHHILWINVFTHTKISKSVIAQWFLGSLHRAVLVLWRFKKCRVCGILPFGAFPIYSICFTIQGLNTQKHPQMHRNLTHVHI